MNAVARIEEMESALTPLGAEMVGALGVQAQVAFGELTLVAERERIVEVLTVGFIYEWKKGALEWE